jgi:nitrite reductase/ring-hydroxylating ferredoxin subunit
MERLSVEIDSAAPLREMWYYAMPSSRLGAGRVIAKTFFGEQWLFARTNDGTAFALKDFCPHRGVPLRFGRFDGHEIQCRFHGWRFDRTGRCTAIPSLAEGQNFDLERACAKSLPVREVQGNIWIFNGSDPTAAPEIPVLPDVGEQAPDLVFSLRIPCSIDAAVFGQMDPSHNPFVHISWWWRKRGDVRTKAKSFSPAPYGFTMLPHVASGNLLPYRLLGGAPMSQLIFRLPSTRIELLRFGRHRAATLNTVTPIGDNEIEMSYAAYWTSPLLTAVKPLIRLGLRTFVFQDRDILTMQREGLKHSPDALMFVDDADTQARWYHRLKIEYARARAEGRAFVNPVTERTLHWRS